MISSEELAKWLEHWLEPGETVERHGSGDPKRLHLGATLGGRHQVPYHPPESVLDRFTVDIPATPLPTIPVQQGHFHDDEWVHDPSVRGWVHAAAPNQLAVQCADLLAAVGSSGWFVETSQRIAIVVDAGALDKADAGGEQGVEIESTGVARLFGKARAAVNAVADLTENLRGPTAVVVWEFPVVNMVEVAWKIRGRASMGLDCLVSRFPDGSVLELRT